MTYERWFEAGTAQEVLFKIREFLVQDGIKDVSAISVFPRVAKDSLAVIGYSGIVFYQKEE